MFYSFQNEILSFECKKISPLKFGSNVTIKGINLTLLIIQCICFKQQKHDLSKIKLTY